MTNPPIISTLSNLATIQTISAGTNTSGTTNAPTMLGIAPGSFVNGFVVNRDRGGNAILRTEKGDLVIKSELFLKTGSEIVIKFERTVNETRARIISVDGEDFYTLQAKEAAPPDKADKILNSSLIAPSTDTEEAALLSKSANNAKDVVVKAILVSETAIKPEQLQELAKTIKLPAGNIQAGTQIMLKLVSSDVSQVTLAQTISQAAQAASSVLTDEALVMKPPAPQPAAPPMTGAQYAAYNKQTVVSSLPPQQSPIPAAPAVSTAMPPVTPQAATTAQPSAAPPLPAMPDHASLRPLAPMPPTVATTEATPPLAAAPAAPPTVATTTTPANSTPARVTAEISIPAPPILSTTATPSAPVTQPQDSSPVAQAAPSQPMQLTSPLTPPTPNVAPPISYAPPTGPNIAPASLLAAMPQPQNTTPQFLPNNQMQAVVIGTEFSGEMVVQTPLGTVKLPLEHSLPTGTRLVFELISIQSPQSSQVSGSAVTSLLTTSDSTITELARTWPAFSQLVQAVAQHDPAAASLLIQKSIPQIGRNFTTGLLFFISALRGGDMRQWLSQKVVSALEQSGNSELLLKVNNEFTTIRNSFLSAADNNWQPLFVPIAHGNELTQARMYYKRDNSKEKDGKPSPSAGTRFIMEIDFSELGPMQMDGFVKKKDNATLFDLIIRTIKAFSPSMQQDITQIFNKAAEMTGFKGNMQIITSKEFPINPMESAVSEYNRNLIA